MAGPSADPTHCENAVETSGGSGCLGCCCGPSVAAVWQTEGDASAGPMRHACVLGASGGFDRLDCDCHPVVGPMRHVSEIGTSCATCRLGCCGGPSAAAAQRTGIDASAGPMRPSCVLGASGGFDRFDCDCHQAGGPTCCESVVRTSWGLSRLCYCYDPSAAAVRRIGGHASVGPMPVSYTHLTLPTKRIV